MKKAVYKVPGGKLIKLFLEEQNGEIASLTLTGDFFMHPEEAVTDLERALVGAPLNLELLTAHLRDWVSSNHVTLFGLDAEAIAQTILQAHHS